MRTLLQDNGRLRAWAFWILVGVAALLFVFFVRSILLPFVAGLVIAYFLDPLVDWMERRGIGRIGGTTIVTLLYIGVIVLIVAFVGPLITNQLVELVANMPAAAKQLQERLLGVLDALSAETGFDLRSQLQGSLSSITGMVSAALADVLKSLVQGGLAVASILSLIIITPFVAFFLLLQWENMVTQVDDLLPRRHLATLRQLFKRMDEVLGGFLRGQAAVCAVMAVYYATALSLCGLRYGLVIGLIAGILTFVPFLGALTGLLLTAGFAVVQYDSFLAMALPVGLYLLGQTVESYVITPRLVGRQIGLHDVWVIFSVLAGGALFGVWGVLLAVPVAGCIGVLVRFAVERYRASRYYRGGEPE